MIGNNFSDRLGKTSGSGNEFTLSFTSPKQVTYVVIMEDIKSGERIREYKLSGMADGKWQPLSQGTCVGHKRIEIIKEGKFSAVRLEITKSEGKPFIRNITCYGR